MPLPVIANIYRCALLWDNGAGATAVNVIHVRLGGSISDDVYNLLNTSVAADMWRSVSSEFKINTVDITPLDGTTATSTYATAGATQWSGHGSAAWVAACSAIVKWPTLTRGRSYQGRTFLPFTGESQINDSALVSTDRAAMQTAWDTFRDDIVTGGGSIVVASYGLSVATDVELPVVETSLATQRRRQDRLRT